MAAFALISLIVGGPAGMCLALAYGVTSFMKIAKVDAQYAANGQTTPGYRLIEKWLDGRKAAGKAPADAKPAKYGMWRYGWQRWRAMWELAAQQHRTQHEQLLKAREEAARNGQPLPAMPSAEERSKSSFKWVIDKLVTPVGEKPAAEKAAAGQAPAATTGDGPIVTCPECGQKLVKRGKEWEHPSSSGCAKGAGAKPETKAAVPAPPGDRAVAVAPAGKGGCPRCGGAVSRDLVNDLGLFCPTCDKVPPPRYLAGNKDLDRQRCERCGYPGRMVVVSPRTRSNDVGGTTTGFIHHITGTTACPTKEQKVDHQRQLEQIIPTRGVGPVSVSRADDADDAYRRLSGDDDRDVITLKTERFWWRCARCEHREDGYRTKEDAHAAAQAHDCPATTNEGDTMTTTAQPVSTQQSGEVVGLISAINYAGAVAAAHEAHSQGGGETYTASLAQAEVGPETIQSAGAAQEASQIAAAAWRAHEAKLKEQLAAKEAITAETGSKNFLLAE